MKKLKNIAAASALLTVLLSAAPVSQAAYQHHGEYTANTHVGHYAGARHTDSANDANVIKNDRDELRRPHGRVFYIADKVKDVNIAKQMEKARYLTVTGQDYGLAKAILDQVIEVNDKVSEAYLLRGICLTDMEKFNDAENDYKAALMLEPENPTFYYFRALNQLTWNHWDHNRDARRQFNKALEIEPHYLDAIVGVGDSYFQEKDYTKAIEYYDKVLAAFPHHDVVLAKKQDANAAIQAAKDKREEEERQRKLRQRIG